MNERLNNLLMTIDARSKREKILLLVVGIVVVYLIWEQLLWKPAQASISAVRDEILQTKEEVATTTSEMAAVIAASQDDKRPLLKKQRDMLLQELETIEEEIKSFSENNVPPSQMATMLERVLADYQGLKLVFMQRLPIDNSEGSNEEDATDDDGLDGVYKHPFLLVLEGNFFDALAYLQQLESLDWHFYWDEFQLDVKQYPAATIVIKVHTLSEQESWIGV